MHRQLNWKLFVTYNAGSSSIQPVVGTARETDAVQMVVH